jgi:hypothetical protein
MDIPLPAAAPEAGPDRRELLDQEFSKLDGDASPAPAPAPAPPLPPMDPVDEPVWKRPPASWKKDFHEAWQKADDRLKEYAWTREEQMRKGVEPLLTKAQFADRMQEAINPYRNTIAGLGLTEDKAVGELLKADHQLRTSAPEQKLAMFRQLAQSYGIQLDGQLPQTLAPADHTLYQLQNELTNVRGEINGWKQQQEQVANAQLLGEISQFSNKAEHFEQARPTMVKLLEAGVAETLEEAYDKAIRLDPELFDTVQKSQQAQIEAARSASADRAAKAARAAAVSVRSSTPGTHTAPKAQDRRSLLAEQIASLSDRL